MGRSEGSLTLPEVALMKAMLRRGTFSNEQIAAYFNHPSRTFNQGRVTDAKQGKRWGADDTEVQTVLKAAAIIGGGGVELANLLPPQQLIFEEPYRSLHDFPLQLFRNVVVQTDILFFGTLQSTSTDK